MRLEVIERIGRLTMDLGIKGRTALVCAASKGLGKGCAMGLAREGVNVTITARTQSDLEAAAEEIRREAPDVTVTAVAGDITTPEGRAAALAGCPHPDILVNNAGGPPPGDFRDWSREDWIRALEANMLTPIELIKATVDTVLHGSGSLAHWPLPRPGSSGADVIRASQLQHAVQ